MELAIGQYGRLGPNKLFGQISPAFRGLGYGMLFVSFLVVIYYNMIMAWTLFYTVAGFQSELPWRNCGNDFNTLTCYSKRMDNQCPDNNYSYWNNSCTNVENICNYYGMKSDIIFRNGTHHCSNDSGVFLLHKVNLFSITMNYN